MNEIQTVKATVRWICPSCHSHNEGKTRYGVFTNFVHCPYCKTKSIVSTEEEEENV